MLRRAFCSALCLVFAASAAPFAGDEKGDVEIGIFGGYGFPDEYEGDRFDFRNLRISDDDLNPDDDFLFGFRVAYFLTSNWSLEGSFQRLSTEAHFDTCLGTPCPRTAQTTTTADVDLDSFRASLLYNWRAGAAIRPFVAAGVGLETTDVEGVMDEDDLGMNAGGGVRFLLGRGFQLRLEGRYVFTEVSNPVDSGQNNLETQVGLSWTFGGSSTPPDTAEEANQDRRKPSPGAGEAP
jgi:outer membrane beta-barrel protein